jgi:hypothetical protein
MDQNTDDCVIVPQSVINNNKQGELARSAHAENHHQTANSISIQNFGHFGKFS